MNIVFNNSIVTLRNEQGFYCYFCDYFHRIFKSKKSINGSVCLIREKSEVTVCCSKCKDFFSGLFFYLKPNSKGYFEDIKKSLIQYIPTVNK